MRGLFLAAALATSCSLINSYDEALPPQAGTGGSASSTSASIGGGGNGDGGEDAGSGGNCGDNCGVAGCASGCCVDECSDGDCSCPSACACNFTCTSPCTVTTNNVTEVTTVTCNADSCDVECKAGGACILDCNSAGNPDQCVISHCGIGNNSSVNDCGDGTFRCNLAC